MTKMLPLELNAIPEVPPKFAPAGSLKVSGTGL
jgi:hypothetical protein